MATTSDNSGGNAEAGGFRVTERQQEVLDAIQNGTTTTGDLANQFGVSYSAISSMMRRLEDHGFVQRDEENGGFMLAGGNQGGGQQAQRNQGGNQGGNQAGGNQAGNNASNRETKIDGARQIFEQNQQQPRKTLLSMFQEQLGMTLAGASTYYQKLRGEYGMTHAMANDGRRNNGGNQGNRGGNNQGSNNRGGAMQGQGNRGGNTGNRGNQGNRGGNRGNQGTRAQASGGRPNLPGQPGNTAGRNSGGGRGNAGTAGRGGNTRSNQGGRR